MLNISLGTESESKRRGKWMDIKRNWHMHVSDFHRGNKTGTEINIAHVENNKRGTDKC